MQCGFAGFTRLRGAGSGVAAIAIAAMTATATLTATASCSSDPASPSPGRDCVPVAPEKASAACTPLYEPSYANVFAQTLQPTCAKSGVSCHASSGKQGGVAFDDADVAYTQLLETTQAVRAGDPACSAIVARVVATDGNVRMPPGRSIDPGEQCAIIQWIANGAKR